jgi:L-fuculose-phosphate aldolase
VSVADQLIDAAEVLDRLGCLNATDGNMSSRLEDDRVLITRSGISKRRMNRDALVIASLDDAKPCDVSSEWPMHRSLYQSRPDVNCVLHVHAPYMTAFAVGRRIPDIRLLAEGALTVGEIVYVPFVIPGTNAVGTEMIRVSATAGVYLLANHGVVAVGSSVEDALYRMERAEFLAKIELHARMMGETTPIPDALIKQMTGERP